MTLKPTCGEQHVSIRAADCVDQETCEKRARIDCRGSRMGSDTLPPGNIDGMRAVAMVADGDRREAHQRAVPGGVRVSASCSCVSALFKFAERRPRGEADVETPSGRAVCASAPPPHEALHQIDFIEIAVFDQAICKAKRHAGIVGPFPWYKVERATSYHVGQWRIGVARSELQRGANCVADREAEQAPAGSILGRAG